MDEGHQRVTPIGWANYAHSYAASAQALEQNLPRATHPDAVLRYLYRHAIELYLKAFLLQRGTSVAELRHQHGHNTESLVDAARSLQLPLTDVQRDQIAFLKNALPDRYLETGFRHILDEATMLDLCRHLHASIVPSIYHEAKIARIPVL